MKMDIKFLPEAQAKKIKTGKDEKESYFNNNPNESNEKLTKYKNDNKNLKIISLNANHLKNKLIELEELINMDKPDIVFLQETHRTKEDKPLKILNYNIIETLKTENESSNGLLIAIKTEYEEYYNLEKINDYEISIKLRKKDHKTLIITNVYIPCIANRDKCFLNLKSKMNNNRKNIAIGDWNTDRKDMIEFLVKNNIKATILKPKLVD